MKGVASRSFSFRAEKRSEQQRRAREVRAEQAARAALAREKAAVDAVDRAKEARVQPVRLACAALVEAAVCDANARVDTVRRAKRMAAARQDRVCVKNPGT